jgi:hypothetical protein
MNAPVAQLRRLDMRNSQLVENAQLGTQPAHPEAFTRPSPAKELRAQLRAQLGRNQVVALPPGKGSEVAPKLRPSAQAKLAELHQIVAWLRNAEPDRWTDADEADAIAVGECDIESALISLRALKREKGDLEWGRSAWYRKGG